MNSPRQLSSLSSHEKRQLLRRLLNDKVVGRTVTARAALTPDVTRQYEPFPLTEIQRAYWIGRSEGFDLAGVAAHTYLEIEAPGVEVVRLERAWQAVIDRHGMLRAVVLPNGTQQVCRDVPPYRIHTVDLRSRTADEVSVARAEIRGRMSHQMHRPDRWPLFEILAVLADGPRLRLHVSADLLCLDFLSIQIALRDLLQLYLEPTRTLPALELSFRDYVVAAESWKSSTQYASARDYWLGRAASLPCAPELPLAKRPREVGRPKFVRHAARLDRAAWRALQDHGSSRGMTSSGVLLAAFSEVLAAWSRRPHFTLNLTLFNRQPVHAQVMEVVGDFTSLTLVEVDYRGDEAFEQRAKRLQQQLWSDLEHRHFSGVEVLRELVRVHGNATRAAMPVVFTSALGRLGAAQPELPGELVYGLSQTPQVWLDHQVVEQGGVLIYSWDVVEGLFEAGVVEAMFAAYQQLLERLSSEPAAWQGTAGALLPSEQRARRAHVNATADTQLAERLLHEVVFETARAVPEQLAVITPERRLSYRELARRAVRVGQLLRQDGAERGERVGIVMQKGWEQVVGVLGVLASGAAYLPIDPELPLHRQHQLLHDAKVQRVLTQSWLSNTLGLRSWNIDALDEAEDETLDSVQRPTDLAYVIYTSGSTGKPKGVMIDHGGAWNTIAEINRRLELSQTDRVLGLSALSFDLSVYDIFGPLSVGATVVYPSANQQREVAHWFDWMRSERVTVWNSVPAMMQLATESGLPTDGMSLRHVMLSGDWIPVTLPGLVQQRWPESRVLSLGGATEASIWSVWHEVQRGDEQRASIPYGQPLANQQLRVCSETGEDCPDWVSGDLWIGGRGVALGYWGDEALSQARFVERAGMRWYRTGDVARYCPNGDLEFLGREDLQVKVQGYRIELGEIESVLSRVAGLEAAAVVATETRGSKRLVAYVVARDSDEGLQERAREHARGQLPHYMVPSQIVLLPALPLTANGKLDRRRLAELPTVASDPSQRIAPRDEMERLVAEVWAQVLGTSEPGIDESFFALGGQSMLAIQVVAQLRERLGIQLPLRVFLEQPTIREIAAALHERAGEVSEEPQRVAVLARPEERHLPFGLTDVQQAYWMGRNSHWDLGGVSCQAYFELDVRGIELGRLERAWNLIIQRHDMLRAIVLPDGRQQILSEVPQYRIEVEDLSQSSQVAAESWIIALRERMSRQVLPCERWPLFELRADLLPEGKTRLHLCVDLLIMDFWSLAILYRDLLLLYDEPTRALPALELSFRDYVVAAESWKSSAQYTSARDYWLGRAASLPCAPELPLAKRPREVGRPKFVRHAARLDRAAWRALQDKGASRGMTSSGVLLAAFSEVLAAWSRRAHFTLNLTLFNRQPVHPQVMEVVGDFTSLTLVEVDYRGDEAFEQRAKRLQQQLWSDLEHRHFSGVEVLRELVRIHGDATWAATMPVVFSSALQGGELAGEQVPGELVYGLSQTPQVWLDHQVVEQGGVLIYSWDVVEGLFEAGVVEAMFVAYQQLLERLSSEPAAWQGTAGALLPSEQRARRAHVNATADTQLAERLLHEVVFETARAVPEQLAVITPERRLSYRELARRAVRVGQLLRQDGAERGERVGIVMQKGWEQVVGVLGVLASGAAYLPIDPELPLHRQHQLLHDAKVQRVLTQSWLANTLELEPTLRTWHIDALDEAENETLDSVQSPTDLAYVIYTSGSTGKPKGVMIDHGGAWNTIAEINRRLELSQTDRVLGLSALSFDLSVYDIFGPLSVGAAVVYPSANQQREVSHWFELMRSERVTVWNSVPAMMQLATESGLPTDGMSLRHVMLSGDWIPVTLPGLVQQRWPESRVLSLGGATEASIWSVWHEVQRGDEQRASIPYGQPLANQQLRVCSETGEDCPDWVSGDLWIGGRGVALGYWGDEALSQTRFVDRAGMRWYRTGDVARYCPNGDLEFLGREDLQVKVQGYRIELGEIESVLSRVAGLEAAAVVATETRGSKRLVAYVVARADSDEGLAERAREHARAQLPHYMVPSQIVLLPALPLTANGKLDRRRLAELPTVASDPSQRIAPRDEMERLVAEVWAQVLGTSEPGIDESFFALGGQSMLAIQVVAQLRERLRIQLPLRVFLEQPTIREIAAALHERAGEVSEEQRVVVLARPEERHLPFGLTDVQQAYWMGRNSHWDLGGVSCQAYFELDVRGIELGRLERAWNLIIQRHDMLRAIVLPDGRQQILSEVPQYHIEVEDLRQSSQAAAESRIIALRERMSRQVLPCERWPLFELRADLLPEGKTRLHLCVDLLIMDFWSLAILYRDLLLLYDEPTRTLPALELSFRDYVVAAESWKSSAQYTSARDYWLGRAASLPCAPELPLAKRPREVGRPRFVRHAARLDRAAWRALQDKGASRGMTSSGVLLAAFSEVLAAWSRRAHFTLNLTLFNRQPVHPQVMEVVGDFTSLTLVEVDYRGGEAFEQRAKRLQQQLWSDLEHRHFSGVEVLRELVRIHGDATWAATMPVVFSSALQGGELAGEQVPGELVYGLSQTPQVWLDHQVVEQGGVLIYSWDVVEGLFEAGVVEAMFVAYQQLLERLSSEPAAWQGTAGALLPSEQRARRAHVNATADTQLAERLLHEVVFETARAVPEQLAVITPERRLSYRELARRAVRVGQLLRQDGAERGERVGIVMQKGWEQVVGVLGVLASGAAYLPIDPELPLHRQHQLLHDAKVQRVLTQSWLANTLELEPTLRTWHIDALDEAENETLDSVQSPTDLAYVIYTSGSTGKPKGVMIDHGGAWNTIAEINRRLELSQTDRVLGLSALSFDLSVYDIFGPLSVGAAVVYPSANQQREVSHWFELMRSERVTVWNSVPAMMQLATESGLPTDGMSLRHVMLSGDWIPVTLPGLVQQRWPESRVLSLGGATEASIWSVWHEVQPEDEQRASIPYGQPLANQQLRVCSETGEDCPDWVSGDLWIGGRGVALGYWGDEALSQARFVERAGMRWYRTGDVARYCANGDLEFLGREDLQVKVQGYRIELGEIESVLSRVAGLEAAAVVATETRGSKRLVAYVVARADSDEGLAERAREHARGQLPHYMVPSQIVLLPALPLTANGKLDRRRLAELPSVAPDPSQHVAPRDEMERSLLQIWREVLDVPNIGVTDNLWSLGGDSIKAARIAMRVSHELALTASSPLSFATLLREPTIEQLAKILRSPGAGTTEDFELVMIQEGHGRAPLICVHAVGGLILSYVSLARELGPAVPIYGLQRTAVAKDGQPSSIEGLAARYVKAIRERDPHGPYHLCGWSMGALIAWEMANQLGAAGETEVSLTLLDPSPLEDDRGRAQAHFAELLLRDLSRLTGQDTPPAIVDEHSAELHALAPRMEAALAEWAGPAGWPAVQTEIDIFRDNLAAANAYRPRPLPTEVASRVSFFWARSHNPASRRSWRELVPTAEEHDVLDDHDRLLQAPQVTFVAEKILPLLTQQARR